MTEEHVSFLYNLAGTLPHLGTNILLKSYYLMRCREMASENALPEKLFSSMTRCQKCCIEWKKHTGVQVRAIKLSKKQRRRMRNRKASSNDKYVLNNNEIVQVCTFCKFETVTIAPKPSKAKVKHTIQNRTDENKISKGTCGGKSRKESDNKSVVNMKQKAQTNVYSNAFDVFSLNNRNNTLASTVKEQPKVIKNNKKKKDKFAGLCQKAVLASAKIKDEKLKQNKLHLFLKPSS